MNIGKVTLSALIASTLIAAPAAANAAPLARTAAAVDGEELGSGLSWGLPIAAIIVILTAVIFISDEDESVSP